MSINTENLSKALKDLDALVKRFETMGINQIELDLALAKTRLIYDYLLHIELSKSKSEKIGSEPAIIKSDKKEVEQVFETKESITEQITQKIEDSPLLEPIMELEEETINIEKVQSETDATSSRITVTKQEIKKEIIKIAENDILAEKFKRTEPLINEILARGKRDLSSLHQSKPVKNIESSIGINERFEFIKELFNGDTATYLKTIKILDNSSNFNEAFNYIHQTFLWDYESETVHKILDLVRRRYITD